MSAQNAEYVAVPRAQMAQWIEMMDAVIGCGPTAYQNGVQIQRQMQRLIDGEGR